MKLSELLRTECVRVGSTADDKAMALCDIAALAAKSPICRNVGEEEILEALQDRETFGATAFGNGVAMPHCRLRGIGDFVVGLLTVPNGVDFESPDGEKIKLLVFIIAPPEKSNTHIHLLSALSQLLQSADTVKQMIAADNVNELIDTFVQAAGEEIQTIQPIQHNLVHIFVQDEQVFEHILEAVSGLESVSLSILSAVNARSRLTQLPLYADCAANGAPTDCKVIVVVIERRLGNEIIRRIEGVTGSLFECAGVMVTVQELAYLAGSLEM